MTEDVRSIRLGAARVTVINVGETRVPLTEWIDLPEDRQAPYDTAFFQAARRVPYQAICVRLPDLVVLVDAGAYATPPTSPPAILGYEPPPDLLAQLAAAGVRPEDVDHVVITHGHGDHFDASTIERGGRAEPAFPNARYYLGRADWDADQTQQGLQNHGSLESRTLGVLREHGCLELVEGSRELAPGVQIIAAPGETAGHQVVRFHSEGQTLYCLGDLYHDPVEAVRPHWMVRWADPETNVPSRNMLADAALAENALLVATHIFGVGRLRNTDAGVVWERVTSSG